MELVGSLPESTDMAVLIAQHMPEKFTRTFAERLDRRSLLQVREADHDDVIRAGEVLVCPGMRCMEVVRSGSELRVRVVPPSPSDRYYPSADRLFLSAALAVGPQAIAVVLTGMADDGTRGAIAIREAGGYVIAESQETAVVYGMPRAVVEAGVANDILPLSRISPALCSLERLQQR